MPFIALLLILPGVWLILSGVKNRSPLGSIKTLIDDPTDARGKLAAMDGTWQPTPESADSSTDSGGDTGSIDFKEQTKDRAPSRSGVSGKLSASDLQSLSWAPSHKLSPRAASAFESLNVAYKAAFGANIPVNSSYRPYEEQVRLKATKGKLAATPGKSNHGWGVAVDISGMSYGNKQYTWFMQNAPKYGWNQPTWARKGGSSEEPWHWEYVN